MNNLSFKKNLGLLLLSSLIATPFASAKEVIVGCNGALQNTVFTKLSQLTQSGANQYHYSARDGESVILDFEPGNAAATVLIYFSQANTAPIASSVCSNGDFSLKVSGGNYVNAYGAKELTVDSTDSRGVAVYTDTLANITTGDGIDSIQIKAPTIRPLLLGNSVSSIQTGKGNDKINISNDYYSYAIHAGDGDDSVVLSGTNTNTNNLIVGGAGKDNITTAEGSDLIYGSDVNYNHLNIENVFVRSFADAVSLLRNNLPVRKLEPALMPNIAGDINGGNISSNGGDDIIHGTNGADYIKAGSGNDLVHGWGGADQILGMDGDDQLWGGDQSDSINGENGNDVIYGENGDDRLSGGANADKIFGGNGSDLINGDAGDDWLYGDADNDTLIDTVGNNQLNGGAGTDTCTVIGTNQNTSCER